MYTQEQQYKSYMIIGASAIDFACATTKFCIGPTSSTTLCSILAFQYNSSSYFLFSPNVHVGHSQAYTQCKPTPESTRTGNEPDENIDYQL